MTIQTPYVPNLAGVYTVTLVYSWNGPSTVTRSFFVTVIDPCILAVTPPDSFANISRNISKLDYLVNVAPMITGPYASNCIFSIGIIIVKTTTPDTSSSAFVWTNMVDAPFVDLNKGIVTLIKNTYDPSFAGVYNFQINYAWAVTLTATRTLMITIVDPCLSELIPPQTIASQVIKYGDRNSALDISVFI